MDPVVRDEWLVALRDPSARQGRDYLGRPDGRRCCLGVLCDVAVRRGVIPAPVVAEGGRYLLYAKQSGLLPREVAAWSGFADTDPVRYQGQTLNLVMLNDELVPFSVIADLIEEQSGEWER